MVLVPFGGGCGFLLVAFIVRLAFQCCHVDNEGRYQVNHGLKTHPAKFVVRRLNGDEVELDIDDESPLVEGNISWGALRALRTLARFFFFVFFDLRPHPSGFIRRGVGRDVAPVLIDLRAAASQAMPIFGHPLSYNLHRSNAVNDEENEVLNSIPVADACALGRNNDITDLTLVYGPDLSANPDDRDFAPLLGR